MASKSVVVQKPRYADYTLAMIFDEAVEKHADLPALRYKSHGAWKDISYRQLGQRAQDFANGLLSFGLKKGDRVALFSRNCPEWAIADWAIVSTGFVAVPIYDTLTAEKAQYILNDSGASAIVVQTREHLVKIRGVRKKLPRLEKIIVIEEVFEKELEEGEHLFDRVYALGQTYAARHPNERERLSAGVRPGDLASIVYTSGTTGEPKGALLTHGNFASNAVACQDLVPVEPGWVSLSFLPLSHVFERLGGHFYLVNKGATIAYAESIEKVPENLLEVRPQVMFSVPRLYEKIYARIQDKVRSGSFLKRYLFRKAVETGKQLVKERYELKVESPSTVRRWKRYDRLVFSKLRERVGGRLEFAVSGGAPLSREIHEFFTAAGMTLLQGYGLTETSPVLAVNTHKNFRIGSVGQPIPGAEIKIAEDGEILAKGPMVFQGYHNKAAETRDAFTRDGWFRTGDIGHLDEEGFLFVTDRKKELIVMSNGKKVAPQPIENDLKTKQGVGMAVIIGNDRQYIAALLSPDFEGLKKYAQERGIQFKDMQDLMTRQEILQLFQNHMDAVNAGLSRYEQIKKFRLLPTEFSQESGELTPTLKIKRRVINEKFKGEIQALYSGDGQKSE